MLSPERYFTSGLYRVEISGWDLEEIFFVEKAELEWDEETGRRVRLRRPLRKGSLIFVRLLQTLSAERAYPMAYQVDTIEAEEDGYCRYRLKQVQSRSKLMAKTIH